MDYKGYKLHAAALKKPDGRWSAEVVIEQPAVDDAEDFAFSDPAILHDSAEAAEAAAIELGKRIVDGEHPEFRLPG